MDKSVARDLSSEKPSGRHTFEGVVRVPWLGWQFKLAAQSPDRAPAAVATAVLTFVGAASIWPAALALATDQAPMPPWTILAAAAAFAITLIGETRFALWYQQRHRRYEDLTKTEGNPTDRGDVLIEDQQTHEMEMGSAQELWAAVSLTSSPWSPPALGMAYLILAAAALLPAAVFTGLATLIHGATAEAITAEIFAVITSAACGIAMMVRVEQLERPITPPDATGHGPSER